MSDDAPSLVTQIVGILVAAAVGIWAWVVRQIGGRYLASVDRKDKTVTDLGEKVDRLGERIANIEGQLRRHN